ncbi:MAG TPA: PAS domain S-box protein [Candidatus Acidoferrales bacterium]|nr:PAS domain S-box protein [Candidatus Acidoferrales bacterium]
MTRSKVEHSLEPLSNFSKVERHQWWLWVTAVAVTLLLTAGMFSIALPALEGPGEHFSIFGLSRSLRGLLGIVLLFDFYCLYQQYQIARIRRRMVENEKLFHLIGEHAADMIAVVDSRGNRLYNSPSYQRILGYSPAELRGTSGLNQVHPEDWPRIMAATKEAFEHGTSCNLEYRIRHKDGTWRNFESTAAAVRGENGGPDKLVIVNRDITQRKQSAEELRKKEAQLRQAQKMEAVGQLSGGIAHDFNNLLSVIIGYSDLMPLNFDNPGALGRNAAEIREAAQRAAGLTRQLLAFSRQQVLQPRILDLNSVVSDMTKMLRRLIGENIKLTTDFGEISKIKADQNQIEQVLVNLVVNARDAMPEGGRLLISTADEQLSIDALAAAFPVTPGAYVCLRVSDTGSGMDEETKSRIFEPFFTTKEKGKGTGLGLATVYGIVKQSLGYVWVDSKPGEGAAFRIYFPVASAAEAEQSAHAPAAPDRLQGSETILFAEDLGPLRSLGEEILTRSGYRVITAANGAEALEKARAYGRTIDLLVTDVVMPEMGGIELAQRLSALRPGISIIYTSGYSEYEVGRSAFPQDAIKLPKPYSPEVLLKMVRSVLDRTREKVPSLS